MNKSQTQREFEAWYGFEEWAADRVMNGMEKAFARAAWKAATEATREDCWNEINAAIRKGPLPGDGWDQSAERNGLVLASNIVRNGMSPNEQS